VKIEVLATGVEKAASELKRMTEQLREMDAAAQEVVYSLDEPTDDASKQRAEALKEEADAVDGLAGKLLELGEKSLKSGSKLAESALMKSLTKERIKGIQDQLGELGKTLEGLVTEKLKEDGAELFQGMSEEAQVFGSTALSLVDGVATGFSQGGPIGAAIGGLNSLIKTVVNEFTESQKRIKASEEALQTAIAESAERNRKRKQEATNKAIKNAYDAETEALREQSEELDKIRGQWDANKKLKESENRLATAQAQDAGVPEEVIALHAIEQGLQGDLDGLTHGLDVARENAALARKAQDNATRQWESFATHEVQQKAAAKEKLDEATEGVKQADHAVEKLEDELSTLAQSATTDAQAEVVGVGTTMREKMADVADDLEESLKAEVEELGGKATPMVIGSLKQLTKIMEDGVVKPEEVAELTQVLHTLTGSQEAKDAAVKKGMEQLLETTENYRVMFTQMLGKFEEQRRSLEGQQIRQSTPMRQF